MSLTVENLSKKYNSLLRKSKNTVENLSFTIDDGQVYALIGQNGVGKTTTIKCILKYIKMDAGKILVDSEDIETLMCMNKVGYLPENLIFPNIISLEEFLFDLCILRGMDKVIAKQKIEELTTRFKLHDVLGKNINKFSKGMKKKVGYIQAIINDPKILILDEPTDGLDPISRKDVLNSIREIANNGNIVLITSHLLSDLNLICDRVGLMNEGKLISEINPAQLLKDKTAKIILELYKESTKEYVTYELKSSTIINTHDIDKCIIQKVIYENLDLEDWYYKELLSRGTI